MATGDKFVKPARLPRGAYEKPLGEVIGAYQWGKEIRYCKTHPLSKWGKSVMSGKFYAHCREGFKKKELCEVGK